jgi:hypothetical protein
MRLRKPRRYSCGDVIVFGLELAADEQLPDGARTCAASSFPGVGCG